MFRVVCYVDDKNLAGFLKTLPGIARGEPSVSPVVNAEEPKTKGSIKAATGGSVLEMLTNYLQKRKSTRVTAADLREFAKTIGMNSGHAGNYIWKVGTSAGILKSTKKKGTYGVKVS